MNPNSFLSNFSSELKYSSRLALPLVASELINALNGFIATVMVAHLGKVPLAANALVWGIYITVLVFFLGVFNAVSILVSQSYGAKDDAAIGICFKQGLLLAIIFALPMMLIMWFSPIILVWTGQDATVVECAKPLFYSLTYSMLMFNIIIVSEQFLIGINKTRAVMFISTITVPIQIICYYAFIFGSLGAPKLGLAGIGFGLFASDTAISIVLLLYLYFSQGLKKYDLFTRWWVFNRKFLFEMIRVGLPLGLMFCIEVTLFAVIAIMMGKLGTTELAAYQISYQYMMVPLVILFALGATATVRVGREVGRNNRDAMRLASMVNMGMGIGLIFLFSLVYMIFPRFVIGFDIDVNAADLQPLVRQASLFLSMVGILLLIDCVRLISFGALRGLKDTKFPVLVSIFGFWCVAFSLAYLFAFKFSWDGLGIWMGLIIGLFLTGVILVIRFVRLSQRIDLVSLVTKSVVTDVHEKT